METRRESFGRKLLLPLAFGVALVLFLCSLLTILSAPTAWLWIIAILIGEWGHYVALIAILLATMTWSGRRLGRATALFAIAAAGFCLWPLFQADFIGASLPTRCSLALPEIETTNAEQSPFRLRDLFTTPPTADVGVAEHVYAVDGPKDLRLDLYQSSDASEPQPLVVVIHGGSWNSGNKEQLPSLNRYLAHQHYAVAAINYRHAPKSPFPAAVEDVFRAIDYLKAHAPEWHLDTSRIVLIGRSAGGQIALSAGYAGREPAIRGVVSFYGPADLVLGYDVPSRRWVLDSKRVLEGYLGGSPAQNPDAYRAGSAINFVNAATPPTLLIHGRLDPIVWPQQSERLAARLREFNRPHLFLELPWATHGCDANPNGPSGQLSRFAIERFLAFATRKSDPAFGAP